MEREPGLNAALERLANANEQLKIAIGREFLATRIGRAIERMRAWLSQRFTNDDD